MTALLIAEEIPARPAPDVPLPAAFRAELNGFDEPVHGSLCDPSAARPGDYTLGESGNWLRVLAVDASAGGWVVWAGRLPGAGLAVAAGRQVWVWRAADVLVWAVLGESAGGAA